MIFIAVWLLVFAIAPMRHLALVQLQQTIWPISILAGARDENLSYSELVAQRPNDARVWMAAADEYWLATREADEDGVPHTTKTASLRLFPGEREKDDHAEKRRRLDIVIEKFPNQPWLLAKRLKYSWSYIFGDRIGGELADVNLAANKAAGKPSPERRTLGSYQTALKTQELQRILELCARGQKLEPNNAYYDWTRAYFLALAWRDREAWQALDAAAQKSDFDEHQLEDVRARMTAREIMLSRPLLWEEKIVMSSGTLFPQFARYREFARIVSWQSIKAQRRGDHVLALRLIGSLAKVSALMRDNSKFLIEKLVAIAMESIAVSGATYDARKGLLPPTWKKGTSAQQTQTRISSAGDYAIAHGRRDLADWLAKDSVKAAAGRAPINFTDFAGTSFHDAGFIALLRMSGTLLLMTLPLSLVAWLFAGWVFKIQRLKKLLQADAPVLFESEKIKTRDIVSATLACGGLNLLGFATLGGLTVALTAGLFAVGLGQWSELQSSIQNFWSSLQGVPGNSSGLWESLFYQLINGENDLIDPFAGDLYHTAGRWLLALLPIAIGALWCATTAVARQKQWQRISNGEELFKKQGALATARAMLHRQGTRPQVARLETAPQSHFDAGEFVMDMGRGLGVGGFYIMWLLAAFWPNRDEASEFYIPLLIALAIGAASCFDYFKQWLKRRGAFNHRRRAARFGLRLMRESQLGWLALGSVLFLLTLLISIPLRARADAALTRYLTLGETAMMK